MYGFAIFHMLCRSSAGLSRRWMLESDVTFSKRLSFIDWPTVWTKVNHPRFQVFVLDQTLSAAWAPSQSEWDLFLSVFLVWVFLSMFCDFLHARVVPFYMTEKSMTDFAEHRARQMHQIMQMGRFSSTPAPTELHFHSPCCGCTFKIRNRGARQEVFLFTMLTTRRCYLGTCTPPVKCRVRLVCLYSKTLFFI